MQGVTASWCTEKREFLVFETDHMIGWRDKQRSWKSERRILLRLRHCLFLHNILYIFLYANTINVRFHYVAC
jgi:hypothetical protein